MATVKRTTTPITKHVPAYQLTITEGEADFLLAVLARIGGHSSQSPRKYSNSIRRALTEATGYNYLDSDAYRLSEKEKDLYFNEYPAGEKRRYA